MVGGEPRPSGKNEDAGRNVERGPGAAPADVPAASPIIAPGTAPVSAPGAAPGTGPGTAPRTAPAAGSAKEDLQGRILKAQAVILQKALGNGVKVSFGEGGRATDVAMALLKGDRDAVLALPAQLEDLLDFDLHILRSAFARETFELLLVFVEPLDQQALRSPERRRHLRRRLQQVAADEEGERLLEQGTAADAD